MMSATVFHCFFKLCLLLQAWIYGQLSYLDIDLYKCYEKVQHSTDFTPYGIHISQFYPSAQERQDPSPMLTVRPAFQPTAKQASIPWHAPVPMSMDVPTSDATWWHAIHINHSVIWSTCINTSRKTMKDLMMWRILWNFVLSLCGNMTHLYWNACCNVVVLVW